MSLIESIPSPTPLVAVQRKSQGWSLQTGSAFLRLPGELRNEIYYLLLHSSTYAPYEAQYPTSRNCRQPLANLHPAILRTCRQIYDEALPYLYATHAFQAHNSLLTSFPSLNASHPPVISPRCLQLVHHWRISVRLDIDNKFTAKGLADAFSGCESLVVEVGQAEWAKSGCRVLEMFAQGVRNVGWCSVRGVDRDVADWLEHTMMSSSAVEDRQDEPQELTIELGDCGWEEDW